MQFELEKKIIKALKTVFDPEIPVNIYDLGLIYEVLVDDNKFVTITMTLTAPNCPMADELVNDVYERVKEIDDVLDVKVNLTFEPTWNKEMMSEEAMLELGFL
jgi:FeS assembly SUF system protein